MTMIAATLLAALALLLAGSSLPRLRQALGDQNHPEAPRRLIASLRRLIVGTALGVVAAGVFSGQTWLLAFGLVFLFEEIFECSVHLAIVKSGSPPARAAGRH